MENNTYFKLWRLMCEKIANKAISDTEYSFEKEIYNSLLREMAILEAEVILEE